MGFYDDHILPHVCGALMKMADGDPGFAALIEPRFLEAEGDILEIGVGTGRALALYDATRVNSFVGIDPDKTTTLEAEQIGETMSFPVEIIRAGAEQLDFDNVSFDTVLSNFTQCTIPNLAAALEECRRVLRPGGKLVFSEHGRAPDWRYYLQRLEEPSHKFLLGGCHTTRVIPQSLEDAGFRVSLEHEGYMRTRPFRFPKIWRWCWSGRAVPN